MATDTNTPEYQLWVDKEYEYLIALEALQRANRIVGDDNVLACTIPDHINRQHAAQRIHDRIHLEYIAAANAAGKPHFYAVNWS